MKKHLFKFLLPIFALLGVSLFAFYPAEKEINTLEELGIFEQDQEIEPVILRNTSFSINDIASAQGKSIYDLTPIGANLTSDDPFVVQDGAGGAFKKIDSLDLSNSILSSVISTGLLKVDSGDVVNLIKANGGDNTKLDVLGGEGIIVDRTNQIETGKSIVNQIAWIAQQVDVPALVPAPDRGQVVNFFVNASGTIIYTTNDGQGIPTTQETRDYIWLGWAFLGGGGEVFSWGSSGLWAFDQGQSFRDYANTIGVVNKTVEGFGIAPSVLGTGLQVKMVGGTFATFGIAAQLNSAVITKGDLDPIENYFGTRSDGVLVTTELSGVDAGNYEHSNTITAFSDQGGGTVRVTVTDTNDFEIGDTVVITDTTDYNGTQTITAINPGYFEYIDTFHTGETSGKVFGLTSLDGGFQVIRFFLFPNAVGTAENLAYHYGRIKYATLADAVESISNGEDPFKETPTTGGGIFVGFWSVKGSTTNLANPENQFREPRNLRGY